MLVVEDDPIVRDCVSHWLAEAGWRAVSAASAGEALQIVERSRPAVVLCDVDLGDGPDGLSLADDLHRRHRSIALIFTTANDRLPGAATLRRGVTGYLLKPYDRGELVALVSAAVADWRDMQNGAMESQQLLDELATRRAELHRRIARLRFAIAATETPRPAAGPDAPPEGTAPRFAGGRLWRLLSGGRAATSGGRAPSMTEDVPAAPLTPVPIGATVLGLVPGFRAARNEFFCDLADRVAARSGLPAGRLPDLRVACSLARLGLAVVPPRLLEAQRALSDAERAVARRYVTEGHVAVRALGWPSAAEFIGQLDDRWDGMGVAQTVDGPALPLESRVLAVIHRLNTLTGARSYRPGLLWRDALQHLEREAGARFDPQVTGVVLSLAKSVVPESA